MNLRHFLMLAGVVVAAWLAFFGDKTSTANIAEPVARVASASPVAAIIASMPQKSPTVLAGASDRPSTIMTLQDRDTFIWDGHNAQQGGNLFNSQSWTPPPPPPPKMPILLPPPPTAPPLSFTYLGKKVEDGVWEVYLARGDKTFIVRAKSVIEGTYQVDAITPPTLSLTYLPLNQVQRLTIGGTD